MIEQETDEDGNVRYFKNGLVHREDGPAIVNTCGYKSWFFDGKLHREDGPAIESLNGYKEYWINGKQLTEDQFNNRNSMELKIVTNEFGTVKYYKDGLLHRLDGPAIEYINGKKEYWKNGKRHRVDGPAVELINGYKEYWINDEELTKDQFNNPENINDILKEFNELQEKLKSLTLKLNKLII